MTNVLLAIIVSVVFGLFGFVIGSRFDNLRRRIEELEARLKEQSPQIGATLGEYGPVNEYSRTNQDGIVGIVESKTPQRVEWEAEQALRREARGE